MAMSYASASVPDAFYRRIVEEAKDAIIFADREGVIRLWNQGAEVIFGFRADEALGDTLDLIIPENLRKRHWDGYYSVMESGATRYETQLLAVPAIKKDGSRISIEFSILPLKDAEGTMLGSVAIIRDVTERWERDRHLKKRLSDLEARAGEARPQDSPS